MAARSRLSIAKADIVKAFEESSKRVFSRGEIERMLAENRDYWRLAQATTTNRFIEFLLSSTKMVLHRFNLPYRPSNRYAWGEVPTLELVQSLRPEGYFTHFTALQLHGLTGQIPRTIYLNFEQQASSRAGRLTQESINRAFKCKCRVSSNVTSFREQRVCLLNGQNTGHLGVTTIETAEKSELRVSNIERTLIDAAVRPIYAGGVFEVARAYRAAYDQFSVNRLVSYLRRLHFTYPYHQAIGFYLQRAEKYSEAQLDLLRHFDIEFDFHLAHDMKETDYDKTWRLFIPKGF